MPVETDPGIRALARHLQDRRALREVAARAESLAGFLDLAHRRAEAVAARNLADRARQALR